MQTLSRSRSSNRLVLFGLLAILMASASWWLASARSPAPVAPLDGLFDSTSRTGASTSARVETLQQRLQADPNDWQSYSQLGLAYLQKARETGDPTYYQKVEEALEKALAFQPQDYASLAARGALALARHDFSAALEWGEKARQVSPGRTYAYGVIVDAQIELGRYAEAIDTLQAMVDLRPDMSSYARVSYLRELHGDTPGAIEMMQLAVDSGLPTAESTAWVRTQLASLYFNNGELGQAEREYRLTLQNYPDYVYALAGLGRLRAARGDVDGAIEYLRQAAGIMPLPEFVITLGDLYRASGRLEAAARQYELVAVIEQLYRASGVDMDMEIALFNADHDRDLPQTLVRARQAYARRPSIHAADVLAWALYKSGRYEEAQAYATEALGLGTKDPLKLFHAGLIALALDDREQARTYLAEALAINPQFSILYAREAGERLQELRVGPSARQNRVASR